MRAPALSEIAVVLALVHAGLVGSFVSAALLFIAFAAMTAERVTTPPKDRSGELEHMIKALEDRLGRLEFKAGMPR